ncbi:MAG TPA: hypothetical protein VMS77_06755 [Conexivisphaerales archaeon]|nr:hypothetical protein [Conexivisphaerales archaeon]
MQAKRPIIDLASPAQVSKYAVAFVVAGGVIWVAGAILYSVQIGSCFSCASAVVGPGVNTSTFSPAAIRNLAWDGLYANLYVATVGLLAIAIGLRAFRRGETWSWYAVAIFAASGILTAKLDEASWGGWYTFIFLGLPPLLGLTPSAGSFLRRAPRTRTLKGA